MPWARGEACDSWGNSTAIAKNCTWANLNSTTAQGTPWVVAVNWTTGASAETDATLSFAAFTDARGAKEKKSVSEGKRIKQQATSPETGCCAVS